MSRYQNPIIEKFETEFEQHVAFCWRLYAENAAEKLKDCVGDLGEHCWLAGFTATTGRHAETLREKYSI
jgi:hypothetical protein